MGASPAPGAARQATTVDEIRPLLELCRSGKLFEVQEWIAAGKPVNLPPRTGKGTRIKSPLRVAIELGFHSLVLVLLRGGATIESDRWSGSMSLALRQRRFDLVQLLVENGFDPASVDLAEVFETWDPELIEYFIDRGADVANGNPLARALCDRIRTALRIFKKYQDRFPSFQEQANIALRYHCMKGNLKWVSLLLWAGADPCAPGPYECDGEPEATDLGATALGLAALYDHFEVFDLRQVRLSASGPAMLEVARWSCKAAGMPVLKKLLDLGLNLNDQENGGSSALQSLLNDMSWSFDAHRWQGLDGEEGLDTPRSREKIEAVRLLAERGVRWAPRDRQDVNSVRRSLLKLTPRYTAEFVLIMTQHRACPKDGLEELLRTPSMKAHVSKYGPQIAKLLASWT